MKELICTVCPRGCHLSVEETPPYTVTGNSCPKGEAYGQNELLHPTRMLTTTVVITGAMHRRLPVKTTASIPKELLFDAMEVINRVSVSAPVTVGQVVVKNLLDTGVDVVATRDMK